MIGREYRLEEAQSAATVKKAVSYSFIDSILELLQDENEDVRARATYALGEIGEPAVKPLTAVLNDKNETARQLDAMV